VIFRSDERRSRDVWGDVIVKNIFRNPSNKSDILFRAGVSNTRPARCVCAARDMVKITKIIAETTVFVV